MSSLANQKGVLHGDAVQELFEIAKKNQFALPAVNVTGTNTVNGVLEAAKAVNSPVIIQFSNGGGVFYAGKTLANTNQEAAIAGSISGAHHVHQLAKAYGVQVILHTDHCAKKLFSNTPLFVLIFFLPLHSRSTNAVFHSERGWQNFSNLFKT